MQEEFAETIANNLTDKCLGLFEEEFSKELVDDVTR